MLILSFAIVCEVRAHSTISGVCVPARVQLTSWHNFFHLLFPFVSDILSPYTNKFLILGYDGFKLFLIHMPCFACGKRVLQLVEAILANNLFFVKDIRDEDKEQIEEIMPAG